MLDKNGVPITDEVAFLTELKPQEVLVALAALKNMLQFVYKSGKDLSLAVTVGIADGLFLEPAKLESNLLKELAAECLQDFSEKQKQELRDIFAEAQSQFAKEIAGGANIRETIRKYPALANTVDLSILLTKRELIDDNGQFLDNIVNIRAITHAVVADVTLKVFNASKNATIQAKGLITPYVAMPEIMSKFLQHLTYTSIFIASKAEELLLSKPLELIDTLLASLAFGAYQRLSDEFTGKIDPAQLKEILGKNVAAEYMTTLEAQNSKYENLHKSIKEKGVEKTYRGKLGQKFSTILDESIVCHAEFPPMVAALVQGAVVTPNTLVATVAVEGYSAGYGIGQMIVATKNFALSAAVAAKDVTISAIGAVQSIIATEDKDKKHHLPRHMINHIHKIQANAALNAQIITSDASTTNHHPKKASNTPAQKKQRRNVQTQRG